MKPVLFHPEATVELEEAAAFYEERCTGLGAALLEEAQRAVSRVQEFPAIGAV